MRRADRKLAPDRAYKPHQPTKDWCVRIRPGGDVNDGVAVPADRRVRIDKSDFYRAVRPCNDPVIKANRRRKAELNRIRRAAKQ